MPSTSDLGEAITLLRGRRTQAEVARRAGVSPVIWSLYESGRRTPREQNLRKVLQGLRCTRLQLEEAAWRIRRRRLLEEEGAARSTGSEEFVEVAVQTAERLRWSSEDLESDSLRHDLRALLSHAAILVEEVLLLLAHHAASSADKRD